MHIVFLGELALDPDVRIGGDTGKPVSLRDGKDPHAAPFRALAERIEQRCKEEAKAGPEITIED
jgi:hypothetical protein